MWCAWRVECKMADLVLSSVITGTIAEFVDYSLFIVGIMMLYYLVRFVLGEGEAEEEAAKRREKVGHWLTSKKEERETKRKHNEETVKTKKEKERREALLGTAKSFLL